MEEFLILRIYGLSSCCVSKGLAVAEAERLPGAVCGPAAVDGESVAIDEAALCGVGEEEDSASDVVGSGKSSHGNAVDDVVVAVGGAGLIHIVHFSFDPPGANSVHTDASTAPLGGESARETDEAVLGGVVGTAVAYAGETGDGGDVDDASLLLLEHESTEATREQEGRDEVDLQHATEVRGGDSFSGRDEADASVIDEDVGPSPAAADCFNAAVDQGFVGDIAEELFAISGGSNVSAGLAIEESQGIAGFGEKFGGATTDALRGSGNDGDFKALRSRRHWNSLRRCIAGVC